MNSAAELFAAAFRMIGALSPFILGFLSIVYANEIIGLIRYAAALRGRRSY